MRTARVGDFLSIWQAHCCGETGGCHKSQTGMNGIVNGVLRFWGVPALLSIVVGPVRVASVLPIES
jgi:hypothetical protein